MSKRISLITVTYQSAETLKDTIESVRRQRFDDLEYIVVDGGSVDGTLDILKNSSDVVDRWISEPDNGIYDAMNKGIALASGEVIGFLHADDMFANGEVIGNVLDRYDDSKFHLLYGDLEYVRSENPEQVVRFWRSGSFRRQQLQRGWMPPHPTVYVRREFFEKIGGFNTEYRISADYEWLLRALSFPSVKVEYLPEVLVRMRMGGASNKSLRNVIAKSGEDLRALKDNGVGGFRTLFWKNASKISQFVRRN
ncbi:glycosyltransferase family 2 protein [Marinilabilia salmonicolor]|jgi:glycosyltransferase|uniref:Glycosyltransferase n=1 Tax=Marinilabilia salmonicolor TaxID=989 RepID=A0A2T0WS39_9BACT|nr:glycosyltransferase family 2 protein [Marinilabilia salmonicolor]PRY89523.1 glycosyltransferase [Marinilabilia salmonicolor]RCW27480.1 glycosyltransferase [Marinilabilia salmonicolor]